MYRLSRTANKSRHAVPPAVARTMALALLAICAHVTVGPSEMPFCADDDAGTSCADVVRPFVTEGALSDGRAAALSLYLSSPTPNVARDCASSWQTLVDAQLESSSGGYAYLAKVASRAAVRTAAPTASVRRCWETLQPGWTSCCAPYTAAREQTSEADPEEPGCTLEPAELDACCAFGPGSEAHQAVPVLMEPTIRLWLPEAATSDDDTAAERERPAEVVTLQQDGFLRPFDMPSVLWPAGYLLTEWVAAPAQCGGGGGWRGKRVLELGVGIGASAVAVARCGASSVVATDKAWRALALTAENAALTGVGDRVEVVQFDWEGDGAGAGWEVAAASFAAEHGPFDAILGAALQFETWEERLWPTLTALAAAGTAGTGGGEGSGGGPREVTVALATTAGALQAPQQQSGWSVTQEAIISGDGFGMGDLRGGPSEFEVMHLTLRQ
jgi:predicted nicotinamide N-methyase